MNESVVLRIGHWTVCDFENRLCLKGYGVVESGAGREGTIVALLVRDVALPVTVTTSHCGEIHPKIVAVLKRFTKNLVFDNEDVHSSASCRFVSARGINVLHHVVRRLNMESLFERKCDCSDHTVAPGSLCDFHMTDHYGFAMLDRFMWFNIEYDEKLHNVPRRIKIPLYAMQELETLSTGTNYNEEWALFCTDYDYVNVLNDEACGGLPEAMFVYSNTPFINIKYDSEESAKDQWAEDVEEGACDEDGNPIPTELPRPTQEQIHENLLLCENEYDCFNGGEGSGKGEGTGNGGVVGIDSTASKDTVKQVRRLTLHLPRIPSLNTKVDGIKYIKPWRRGPCNEKVQDPSNCYATVSDWIMQEDGKMLGKGITEHVCAASIKIAGEFDEETLVAPCRVHIRAAPDSVEATDGGALKFNYTLDMNTIYCAPHRCRAPSEKLMDVAFNKLKYFDVKMDGELLKDLLV